MEEIELSITRIQELYKTLRSRNQVSGGASAGTLVGGMLWPPSLFLTVPMTGYTYYRYYKMLNKLSEEVDRLRRLKMGVTDEKVLSIIDKTLDAAILILHDNQYKYLSQKIGDQLDDMHKYVDQKEDDDEKAKND